MIEFSEFQSERLENLHREIRYEPIQRDTAMPKPNSRKHVNVNKVFLPDKILER